MSALLAQALHLFDEYVDLPAAERERRLAELAARDRALHAAVRALLDADTDTDPLPQRSPARILAERRAEAGAAPAPDLRIGARLGAWRIDREIGRGGMGAVYEAHRDDGQYAQRVALKCVRAELGAPDRIAALRAERELLARLDHPGIAALVDAGIDAQGRPWFALRYVEGEPIDDWCDRRRAGIGARVDLLLQVCDAVAYAHAQGVLHRDLKPSNVLVTADGRTQLLDFGISMQFGPLGQVASESAALTPQYAAPEARERGAQGPATDLYALGVLSYRLLSGQWPTPLHRLRGLLPVAGEWQPAPMDRLLDGAPAALAQARGAADAAALARQLRGDLSAIALKAVAERAPDRYPSVAEFADELRRWREYRPLRVRPGTALSRGGKWLRRNTVAAGLGAALVLAAGLGVGAAGWQRQRALQQAQASERVGQLFASTLGAATLSGLGETRFSSRALLERTERELRALPLADQPGVRAHALATLARSYAQIGDYPRAADLAEEAQRISGDGRDAGDDDGFVVATRLSTLNYRGRLTEAMEIGRSRLDALTDDDSDNAARARYAIGAELAQTQWAMGDTAAALARADGLLRQVQASGPDRDALSARALMLRSGFLRSLGRLQQAETDAQRAIALSRPIDAVLADNALERLVDIQRVRQSPQYNATARALLAERQRNLGPAHPETALAEVQVALSLFPDVPRESALDTISKLSKGYGRDNPVYALALSRLAWTLARDGAEELRLQREAVAVLRKTLPRSEMLFNAQSNLAKVLVGRRDPQAPPGFDEGIALLLQTIDERRRAGLPATNEHYALASALTLQGGQASQALARATLDDALEEASRFYEPGDGWLLSLQAIDNVQRYRQGQRERADAGFAQVLRAGAVSARASGRSRNLRDGAMAVALVYRGVRAFQQCDRGRAAGLMDQAVHLAETGLGPAHPRAREARAIRDELRAGRLRARPPFLIPAAWPATPAWRSESCAHHAPATAQAPAP